MCVDTGQGPACLFWVRSSCAFSPVDNSSYPLFNTRAEWVHKCRQETIHCSHVFSENTDKLEAVTFTHGHRSEVKQASRAAAAGCVTACVYKTVWNWPCDSLCLHWTITCSGLDWDWCTPCSQAVVPAQQLGQHWSVTGTTCAASCFLQNTQAQSELWASSPIRRGKEVRLWFLLSWGYNVNSKPKFEMPLFEIMLMFGSSELH